MAKVEKGKAGKKRRVEDVFPLDRTNFMIIGAGVVVIIAGYIAMMGDTVESFRQLTIAPLLLLFGYCVLIPVGIMYRKRKKTEAPPTPPQAVQQ